MFTHPLASRVKHKLSRWANHLNTANPAGDLEELWCHDAGCGAWIKVTRNVSSHEVQATDLVGGTP